MPSGTSDGPYCELQLRVAKAIAIAVTAVLLSATTAFAYDRIFLRAGDVGADAQFLQQFLDEELEYIRPMIEQDDDDEAREWAKEYIQKWVSFDWLFVGRFDINDDGQDELVVMRGFPTRCASAGCTTHIFQRNEQGWRKLPVFIDPVPSRGTARRRGMPRWVDPSARGRTYEILASEERVAGYRTLVGDEFGARWQPASEFTDMLLIEEAKYRGLPGQYLLLCFSPQCAHESREPLVKPPRR